MTPWDALGVQCQHAVDFLGYSPELWDAEAAVAARRFQEIGGTGFGRFPEPRRAQAQVLMVYLMARLRLMAPPKTVVGVRLDPGVCVSPLRSVFMPNTHTGPGAGRWELSLIHI